MNVGTFHFENLIPPPEVSELKHTDYYIRHGEGLKSVRKIFSKVQFEDFELEGIRDLKQAVLRENLSLPSFWEDKHFLLYCYNSGFQIENSLKNVRMHLEWLANPRWHIVTDRITQIWKEGIIYTFGMDKWFRPIIIVNVYLFDLKKYGPDDYLAALCCILSIVRRHMFVPGHVENWNVIIDPNNKSLWSLTSYYDLIKRIIQTLSLNFSSTLEKQFIVNPPSILSFSWSVIEKWLNPETAAKISFASGKTIPQKLLELIDPDQLEEKYGGSVPNLTEFWPPRTHYKTKPHKKLMMKKSTNLNLPMSEEEKEVFFSMDNISETTYELMKSNNNKAGSPHLRSPDTDRYYDIEIREPVIMEREAIKNSRLCGFCESSSTPKTREESSDCTLI